ncbi:UPF0149 family protein [Mangrovicoccus sp. HB161399]|uniref:UPF0149 family protein n=1 Tax=Mangrovicoccus sp. HB161399 TaxID=2720392 RepID=UPI001556BCEF|nr:UPF0149 family protein [Mangrovicoccus sp. HB161399]
MSQSDQDLDRLDALLNALPAENVPMSLSELDGYVTGLLACSEMIAPSEWLPEVWGETGQPGFRDQSAAEETVGAVLAHYNAVAGAMIRSPWIAPIYEADPNSGDVMWEPWVDGFMRGLRLRPEAWQRLLGEADEATLVSMNFLMLLQDIYTGQADLTEDEEDRYDQEAPDMIPNCVAAILQQSRPELARPEAANLPGMPFRAGPRPGRNDPCPCGSGRKYKQCCGRN